MTEFYFETTDQHGTTKEVGAVDLPDLETAKRLAWGSLADLIVEAKDVPDAPLKIVVEDAEHQPAYQVSADGLEV